MPHLFEPLEPRLLLSVVFEMVQPTDPVTPEEYAIWLNQQAQESQASQLSVTGSELGVTDGGSVATLDALAEEQWVPYVPTAEQTNILVMADGTGGTKARVVIVFADAGYRVRDWSTLQQTGNTFSVNAEVEKWTGGAATVITPASHDYDLGSLPDGNYVFQFNAWQQPVESKEFATPAALRPVYRFSSPVLLQRYFYTLSTAERDKLINNYSDVWTYEQVAYYAFATDAEPGISPVYRFWSGTLNTHFYTMNPAERDKLVNNYSQTWAYEGIAFYTYPGGLGYERPVGVNSVYRLWSVTLGTHFFGVSDADWNELYYVSTPVWEWEGFVWYAYQA